MHYSQRSTWVALQLINAMEKENIHSVSDDCHRIKRNIEQQIHMQKKNAVSACMCVKI